jgi:hypothetical protein
MIWLDDLRRQLPDDVVDELLAAAKTEEEIVYPSDLGREGQERDHVLPRLAPRGSGAINGNESSRTF